MPSMFEQSMRQDNTTEELSDEIRRLKKGMAEQAEKIAAFQSENGRLREALDALTDDPDHFAEKASRLEAAIPGVVEVLDYVWAEAEERYGNVDDWRELPQLEPLVAIIGAPGADEPNGVDLIRKERQRQIVKEGWNAQHDDLHTEGELAKAAACYALNLGGRYASEAIGKHWPWEWKWWKPKDRLSDLVRAGALVAGEIDRLLRKARKSDSEKRT